MAMSFDQLYGHPQVVRSPLSEVYNCDFDFYMLEWPKMTI